MKKLIFLGFLGLAVFFTSCDKGLTDIVSPDENSYSTFKSGAVPIDVSELPQTAISYLSDNYPNNSILESERYDYNGGTYFEVELDNNMEFHFDTEGTLVSEGESEDDYIDPSTLPTAVLNYISTNYPNLTIEEAEMELDNSGNTIYEVELSDDTELYFDANGNLLNSYSGDDDDDSTGTQLANLPTSVSQYISTNYGSYTIDEVEIENLFDDMSQQVYEVELEQGNQELTLYFDMSGNFIQEESEITTSFLPVGIMNTINSQYSNYQLNSEASQYNRADDTVWYGVELEKGNQEIELILDSSGNVLYTLND